MFGFGKKKPQEVKLNTDQYSFEVGPEQNIFDMQVTWYELELAASFERNNDIGKSLKKYSKFARRCRCFSVCVFLSI